MCVPGCYEAVAQGLSRRSFIEGAVVAGTAAFSGCAAPPPSPEDASDRGVEAARFPAFRRVIDLTHTYSEAFPHYSGGASVVRGEKLLSTANGDGWNVFRWTLDEHAGTHVDAPIHRAADGITVDRIPAQDLVLPLAVIDIRDKARANPDAELTLDDVIAWEGRHGRLPPGACVALLSGWDARLGTPGFINFDERGVRHFPGFHIEVAELLLLERHATALATDTASFDLGATETFPVHTRWLGAGRWALENAANLAEAPPSGATLVCGAPKIAGATGGPARAFALV